MIISFTFLSFIVFSADFSLDNLSQDKILPADEAFVLSVHKHEEKRIILRWAMKENCFLYEDKFKISLDSKIIEAKNFSGEPIKIDDVYFGRVDVYFNSVSKEIFIDDNTNKLQVSYQGCNEKGFCYPVIKKVIEINNLNIL
tara:strand:+ start:647 stop:1072 length:426 start_codon:yes stop_codon:yes gene_type:complete